MSKSQKELEGWVSVFRTSTDYEADMVRDRLDSAGINAATFTQRDHALNLTVGALARVYVMVPPESANDAMAVLREVISDEELEAAWEGSILDPDRPAEEEPLDSGIERISFGDPEDPPEDEKLA